MTVSCVVAEKIGGVAKYFSVVLIESGFGYGYGLLGNKRSEY